MSRLEAKGAHAPAGKHLPQVLLMGLASLLLGWLYWAIGSVSEAYWRTIIFTVLTISQLGNALAMRSSRQSILQIGLGSNLVMLVSVLLSLLLQLAVIYLPPLQTVFGTTALGPGDLLLCTALGAVVLMAVEFRKRLVRSRMAPAAAQ